MCFLLGTGLGGCATDDPAATGWDAHFEVFEEELQDLQADLAISGLAYVVVENGRVLRTGEFGAARAPDSTSFTAATPLRIASVTKAFSAVVAVQLAESGMLDLEAPARQFAPGLSLPDAVRVRHLLTHTSEGEIGSEYVYGTTRYAMLGKVIEGITDSSLSDVIAQRILEPAGMRSYPSPGLGSHAGLVSTTHDMGAFLVALDRGVLLEPSALERFAIPSRTDAGALLPVSLGWFAQTVQGQRLTWSFGQDDPDHSGALLLRLPDRKLSLFILANANVISDPFRLLMGDASKVAVRDELSAAVCLLCTRAPAAAPCP
jgi:CubicO group peptidase (beta-lactamase class C family)